MRHTAKGSAPYKTHREEEHCEKSCSEHFEKNKIAVNIVREKTAVNIERKTQNIVRKNCSEQCEKRQFQ